MTKQRGRTTLSSGITGLDVILRGGYPAEHAYLIKGVPGTGKSSLVFQFLSTGVQNGESAVYVSFSESLSELQHVADAHGWPLDKIEVAELSSEISIRSSGGSSIFQSAEVELPAVISAIMDLVERVKPTRMGIDSLTELRNIAESDRAYRRALFRLKAALEEHKVTTLFVGATAEPDRSTAESLVHGVIDMKMATPLYGSTHRFLEVTKLRGQGYESGIHDFTIVTGGLKVYPRIRPEKIHRRIGSAGLVRSGIEALDKLVGGWLDRGTNSLILGAAGTGKSSIVLHYALAAAERGEKSTIYSFDEDVETILGRAKAVELPLAQFLESGAIRIAALDASDLSPGHFAHLVTEEVARREISFLAIDSLSGYRHAMPADTALVPHMHDLQVYLGAQGVVAMLTMTLSGLFAANPQQVAHLSYLADTILLLRYIEVGDRIHKSIAAVKQRTRDHEKLIRRLSFGRGGIEIGEPFPPSVSLMGELSTGDETGPIEGVFDEGNEE